MAEIPYRKGPGSDRCSLQEDESIGWKCLTKTDCGAKYETLYEMVSHARGAHSTDKIFCNVGSSCQKSFSTAGGGIGMSVITILMCMV